MYIYLKGAYWGHVVPYFAFTVIDIHRLLLWQIMVLLIILVIQNLLIKLGKLHKSDKDITFWPKTRGDIWSLTNFYWFHPKYMSIYCNLKEAKDQIQD